MLEQSCTIDFISVAMNLYWSVKMFILFVEVNNIADDTIIFPRIVNYQNKSCYTNSI